MAEANLIQTKSSLVKYESPVLVNEKEHKKPPLKPKTAIVSLANEDKEQPPVCPKGDAVAADVKQELEEVLNSIIPPLEWEEAGGLLWQQKVSSTPATRLDVLDLQEQLDLKLEQRQAREAGICPVRRELYSQLFDELIRQVTVSCTERGLLLLRVRDELRMTLLSYQTLYESSCAYGMRKALQSEQGKEDLIESNNQLKVDNDELKNQVTELKARCVQIEQRAQEIREADERKHIEELQFLKRSNQQLKTQLESIIAPKK